MSTPRFYVLEGNALGVRDTVDDNNIHLGSRVEAQDVCDMLNIIHDKVLEYKGTISMQAGRILVLTADIEGYRNVYKRQEQRIIEAEYKAVSFIAAQCRKESEIIAEEHY